MRRRDTQDFFELRVVLTTDETFPAVWCLSGGGLDAHAQRVAPSVARFLHLTSILVAAWVDGPRTVQHGANCERRSMPRDSSRRIPPTAAPWEVSVLQSSGTDHQYQCGKPCRTCDKRLAL